MALKEVILPFECRCPARGENSVRIPQAVGLGCWMNKAEAKQILTAEIAKFRDQAYVELVALVDAPKRTIEITGTSGTRYYLDVLVHWDSEPDSNVRVIGTIDDGGFRAFVPLSESFIMAPDGSFVDEGS